MRRIPDEAHSALTVECEGNRLRLECVGGLVIYADISEVLQALSDDALARQFTRTGVRSMRKAARANGRKGGRPSRSMMDSEGVQFIRLNRPAELKAAGLPWNTYSKAQWAFRTRHENGLADAFRRQGRNVLVNPQRALELLQRQAPS